jgi:hypothetical protein
LAGTSVTDWTTNFEAAIATGKKVFVPKGTYHVSNITCVSGMDIEGEKATGLGIGSHLVVITNDSGAFLNDAAHPDFLSNIRIANFSCTAKTGTTNARFFKQTDKSTYTAYAEFSNNETYQDLVESYDGFFIFTDWDRCRDGYAGNAVGGQTHTFVKAIPATFGQASQTNINQVTKCQIFRNSGANGCLDIAYGALWSIEHTDFEACTTRAVYARGIYALTMRNCWFESLNATEMVVATISPAPNPQGSRPVLLENIYAFCHSSVQYLITIGGASTAGVRNIVLANVPISFKITNASTLTDLENVIVISGSPTDIYNGVKKSVSYELLTSNSEADVNFVNSPYTENQNILPIGPTGLGASNFTLNGFTSATDIASQFGLSSNAVRFSLSGSGNAAYYNLPAKIVKFLRGKTITLTFAGYGSGAGSESVNAAFWEDVGSPSFANKSTSTTYTSGLSYSADMSVGCGKYTVGNSATTLAVGFTAGGNGAGQTYAVESAKLVLGDIKSVSSGFN